MTCVPGDDRGSRGPTITFTPISHVFFYFLSATRGASPSRGPQKPWPSIHETILAEQFSLFFKIRLDFFSSEIYVPVNDKFACYNHACMHACIPLDLSTIVVVHVHIRDHLTKWARRMTHSSSHNRGTRHARHRQCSTSP